MEKESKNVDSDNGLAFFISMYDKFRDSIISYINEYTLEDDIKYMLSKYYKTLLDYNCLGGKNNRGVLVILIYEYIKNRDINSTEWEKVSCLAWCVEILQSSFLVADDIMDNGETRRNKFCWHLLKDVETKNAVNDVLFMYNSLYKLIEIYLRNESCYVDIINAFRDITFKTIIGQHLDTNIFSEKYLDRDKEIDIHDINEPKQQRINLNMINFKVYQNIVIHKTAYYSFFLPIICGMLLAGISINNLMYKKIEDISILLGEYFQIHDDCLEIFGDSKKMGKVGTDIQNNKLTWPLIKIFELCLEEDKAKIIKNYGKNNAACIKAINNIYEKYNIKSYYKEYEKDQKEKILTAINGLNHEGIEYVLKYLMEILFTGAK